MRFSASILYSFLSIICSKGRFNVLSSPQRKRFSVLIPTIQVPLSGLNWSILIQYLILSAFWSNWNIDQTFVVETIRCLFFIRTFLPITEVHTSYINYNAVCNAEAVNAHVLLKFTSAIFKFSSKKVYYSATVIGNWKYFFVILIFLNFSFITKNKKTEGFLSLCEISESDVGDHGPKTISVLC